ncbi:unnamed protein product [Dibothriocephalus latus]|uniref:Uncharacterized protein n=1 Tax=Dibothriocephalus latus TaxID=60516 RepID=A0A3P6R8F7_DIBLA|nr:unnamed protein product [Dibothriocephalus latus]
MIPALPSVDGQVATEDQVQAYLFSDFFKSVYIFEPIYLASGPSARRQISPPPTLLLIAQNRGPIVFTGHSQGRIIPS